MAAAKNALGQYSARTVPARIPVCIPVRLPIRLPIRQPIRRMWTLCPQYPAPHLHGCFPGFSSRILVSPLPTSASAPGLRLFCSQDILTTRSPRRP